MTLSSARVAVVELGRVLGVKPQVLAETRLTSSDYAQLRAELKDSGMLIVDDEGAKERLMEFQSTSTLSHWAGRISIINSAWLVALPLVLDNWQNSPRAGLRNVWSMQFRPNRPNAGNRDAFSRRVRSNQSTFPAARDFLNSTTEVPSIAWPLNSKC